MTRLAAVEKMLYYPTPPHIARDIGAAFRHITGPSIDVCCGGGEALQTLIASSSYASTVTHGVELDAGRAAAARGRLDVVVHAPFESVRGAGFSVVLCNPPYAEGATDRQELEFLRRCVPLLAQNGVLVWIVPERFVRTASWDGLPLAFVGAWRFPDADYAAFQQVVVVLRRASYAGSCDVEIEPWPITRSFAPYAPGAPTLTTAPREPALDGAVWTSDAWRHATAAVSARVRPPLRPLRPAHQALLLAAGAFDGMEVGGELVKGVTTTSEHKTTTVDANGSPIEVTRTARETQFAFLSRDGTLKTLSASDAAVRDWLTENAPAMAASVTATYPETCPVVGAPRGRAPRGGAWFRPQIEAIAAGAQSLRLYGAWLLCGEMGTGKCVQEGTLVFCEDGIVPIEQLATAPLDSAAPLQRSVPTHDGTARNTSHFYNGGLKPCFQLKTRRGFELTGTAVHPVRVADRASAEGWRWKELARVLPGDYVAAHVERYDGGRATMAEDCAWLLGAIIADATLRKVAVVYTKNDSKMRDAVADRARRFLDADPVAAKYGTKAWSLSLRNAPAVWRSLTALGVAPGVARKKSVPLSVLAGNAMVRSAFIRGLFDGDGSVNGRTIEWTTASERLGREVQIVLASLGIWCARAIKKVQLPHWPAARAYWRLQIMGADARRFAAEVQSEHPEKAARLRALLATDCAENTNIDVVPFCGSLLRAAYRSRKRAKDSFSAAWRRYNEEKSMPSRAKVRELAAEAEPSAATAALLALSAPHVRWDRVEAVERVGDRQVYDLTVPEAHSFVANGLQVHNTAIGCAVAAELDRVMVVMCPGHLVDKWKAEFEDVTGKRAVVVEAFSDLDKPAACYVVSKERAKLGAPWRRAVVRSAVRGWACPSCGASAPKDATAKTICGECSSPLWCQERIGGVPTGKARHPLANMIARRFSGRYLLFLDEAHVMASAETDQGQAATRLVSHAWATVVATGTLWDGKASGLFHTLYRASREFRQLFKFGDMRLFTEAHGTMESIVKLDDTTGAYGRRRANVRVREAPGIDPALYRYICHWSTFIRLRDFEAALPGYREEVILTPAHEVSARCASLLLDMRAARYRDPQVAAQCFSEALAWPDCPDDLPTTTKELALIELCLAEKTKGRGVVVYCAQVNKRPVLERLSAALTAAGLRVATLRRDDCTPRLRGSHFEKLTRNADVILTNGQLVETGLDLYWAVTIVQYGIEMSSKRFRQSVRRSFRLGQKRDVRVVLIAFDCQPQSTYVQLLSEKVKAAAMLEDDPVNALAQHATADFDLIMSVRGALGVI